MKKLIHVPVLFVLCCILGANCFAFRNGNSWNQTSGKIWALLVAGSNTWENYRHQADVCHAYHVLHNHGIPDERIVVMMYDDIANNTQNPTPGVVINHPHGPNVYEGVPKDYTGKLVTPTNFLNVLQGSDMKGIGSGKTINSGPNDHIFVYFSDHGAPGMLLFPNETLKARDLNKVLKEMNDKRKFAKLVMYIEACFSGSMFNRLLASDINVYATTAATASQSSLSCYYDGERETYLGDVYSTRWMEDSDKEILSNETLQHQYLLVKKETDQSTVMEFGDLSISKLHVSEFQGRTKGSNRQLPKVPLNSVPSPEVPVAILKHKISKVKSPEEGEHLKKQLTKLIRYRAFMNKTMEGIINYLSVANDNASDYWNSRSELLDFDCYEEVSDYFNQECYELSKNPYAVQLLFLLVNLCEDQIPSEKIKQAMDAVCTHPRIHGIL